MAILGIDEVGRGPLAGPLVVGAVILPKEEKGWFLELKDSKKLSAKKRERLSDLIWQEAAVGLGWVPSSELDVVGISEALRLATRRAVERVQAAKVPFSQIIIDGKVNFLVGTPLSEHVSTMVKADNLIREVSAASIVAKVARDKYMVEVAGKYPGYGFEKHVGYGTAVHLAAIRELGICAEHRKSFEPIRSLVGFRKPKKKASEGVVKNTTAVGLRGEEAVCEYLERLGHKIVVRNFKTKRCEIDVVSVSDGKIYFTEVKTRKNDARGSGIEAVTDAKLKQMEFAAEVFLRFRRGFSELDPLLAVASVDGECQVIDWVPIR